MLVTYILCLASLDECNLHKKAFTKDLQKVSLVDSGYNT